MVNRALSRAVILTVFLASTQQMSSAQQVPARPASSKLPGPESGATSSVPRLDAAINLAQQSLTHIQANVDDYTALFVSRCRVDGELQPLQFANVKIRNRKVQNGDLTTPLSVYMKFLKPENVQGREVIWVENRNDGKLIAHETGDGSLINVKLDPHGMIAMRGQRYPITDIGIENLVVKLIEMGQRVRPYGECEVQFYRDAKIGDAKCLMIQVTHPVQRDHFDFYQARVYFDESLKMPIRYESWSWPTKPGGEPVLEEEFTYLHLKLNTGLTDRDFDISHPAYGFR